MPDFAIPIVFPDYLISVNTPEINVNDYVYDMPWIDILPEKIPSTKQKLPELGHAGIFFIKHSGLTKYYEYGRYDAPQYKGAVRKIRNLPDVSMDANGEPTPSSLKQALQVISRKAGHNGRISAGYIEVTNKFDAMLNYAQKRMFKNNIPSRAEYNITSNSCVHFMKSVMEAAGIDTPWMFDPRPNSYIAEIQDDYPGLEYDPKAHKVKMKEADSFLGGIF